MLFGTSLVRHTSAGHHLKHQARFQIGYLSCCIELLCGEEMLCPYLYRPHLTQRMSFMRGFFPALQSLQNQLPWGISIFKHSRWKAAGQDSQHSRLPPVPSGKYKFFSINRRCCPSPVNATSIIAPPPPNLTAVCSDMLKYIRPIIFTLSLQVCSWLRWKFAKLQNNKALHYPEQKTVKTSACWWSVNSGCDACSGQLIFMK